MPMFLSVVVTFPEFVAVLSVRESSSSPALAEQTLGVLSILDFSPLEVALIHFIVTEPAVMGSYPITALLGLSPCQLSFQAVTWSFPCCQLPFHSSHWCFQKFSYC